MPDVQYDFFIIGRQHPLKRRVTQGHGNKIQGWKHKRRREEVKKLRREEVKGEEERRS
jgi:hypothetical protein